MELATQDANRERPAGVPAEAEYIADEGRWGAGAHVEGVKDGRWRYWSREGKLVEDTTYANGVKYGPSKVFDATTAMAYAVPGAAGLRGDYERGVRVGVWHVLGGDGKRLMSRDFGIAVPVSELADSPALANQRRSAAEWLAVAESFARERRFGEAVVARARAAARSASIGGFLAAFAELSLPATSEGAVHIAEDALVDDELSAMVSGFLRGGSPALLCRALSIWADKADLGFTALDLVNAALLIAPERKEILFTRALVLMRLGLPEQVELDLIGLALAEPSSAAFLRAYNRVMFRPCDFWPADVEPDALQDIEVAQSLEAIRSVIAKYARRLMLLREAASRYVRPDAPWLVRDLTDLLGPDDLTGEETLDLATAELPDVQRMIRADWSALTWLCWCVGLDDVRLPTSISARPANVGGARWEGMEMRGMHPVLASIAEQELAEVTAMLRWLSDAAAASPWEKGVRG